MNRNLTRIPPEIRSVMQRVSASVASRVSTSGSTGCRRPSPQSAERLSCEPEGLATEERRITNFIEFIGDAKGTRALGQALRQA